MGVLTETMTRLRDEIVSLHQARVVLRGDLARQMDERRAQVSALRAGFMRDRAGARRAWLGPTLSERRAAENGQRKLAEEAESKVQEERHKLAEEAKAKAQVEARAGAEERHKLAEEAKAKAQVEARAGAEERPPESRQRHEPSAPAARPLAAPLPHAQKPSFKGPKKH